MSIDKEDVSDYEKIRLKNIAERKKMFENLKRDMTNLKMDMAPKPKFPVAATARKWRMSIVHIPAVASVS